MALLLYLPQRPCQARTGLSGPELLRQPDRQLRPGHHDLGPLDGGRPARWAWVDNPRHGGLTRALGPRVGRWRRWWGAATPWPPFYYGDIEPDFPEGWKLGLRRAFCPAGDKTPFGPRRLGLDRRLGSGA